MRFDLVRPCAECPFRTDRFGYLSKARAEQIANALANSTFACHKTVDYDGEDGEGSVTVDTQHCAGALIMLEKSNLATANQMVRIAERLRIYDHSRLDLDAPVAKDPAEFVAIHSRGDR